MDIVVGLLLLVELGSVLPAAVVPLDDGPVFIAEIKTSILDLFEYVLGFEDT